MMLRPLVVLALCVATASFADEEQFVVVPHPALPGEVPAGSRDDQVLWRDARDAMVRGNQTIKNANMALYDLRYAHLDLDALEKGATPADAERLRALRARIEGPGREVEGAMPRGPLGRCRYEILYFEQSMGADPGDDLGKRLPAKRAEAKKCKEEHQAVIATLGPATARLRAALDEVAPEIRQRMAAAGKAPARTDGGTSSTPGTSDASGKTPGGEPVKP
jgi:hypothetical protein